jgi:transcriptional regulator with XRE-family HTH domain
MSLVSRVRPNGPAIKEFRKLRNLTLQQCASAANIAMSQVFYYETETRRSSVASLLKLAAALDVDPQAICKDDLSEFEIEAVAS